MSRWTFSATIPNLVRVLCQRCRRRTPRCGMVCSRCSRGRLPEGAERPCNRCGTPYKRQRGRRFCDDCTGTRGPGKGLSAQLESQGGASVVRSIERGVPMTDDEIAVALGITRQRVNMIVRSALTKLRAAMSSREDWL